jgi:hypothetical protein
MDWYNVFLFVFFFFFLWIFFSFFPKWFLSILFFLYWAGWEFYFVVFLKKTLWITTIFPHMIFVLLQCLPKYFFQNYICWFFFNIELVENLALTFPTCFFPFFFVFFFKIVFFFFHFLCFFFRIVFVDFIFLILNWLRI